MPQISYRGNLSSAVFPMCLSKAGRTVINPGVDQNFDRRVDPQGTQKDAGIPQAIYMENVLPTPNGYQSIGYKPTIQGDIPVGTGAAIAFIMKVTVPVSSTLLMESILVCYTDGTAQARLATLGWGAVTVSGFSFAGATATTKRSWALVKGICYIQIGSFIATFNGSLLLDITATITGGVAVNIQGIVGAYNYLIICQFDKVFWSSTTTPTDFVPSLVSGSGSEELGANGSWINFVKPHPNGFLIYTLNNVISATYTANRAYPWKFREVGNSGAFLNEFEVSEDTTNSPIQIGITVSGIVQAIAPDGAETIAAEVTDYLERNRVYDSFNLTTNVITQNKDTNLTGAGQFMRRVQYLLDRYVIISFSNSDTNTAHIPVYRYAIVYDYLLKRYGRIRFNHSMAMSLEINGEILLINGLTREVKKLYFDIYDQDTVNANAALRYKHEGVLIVGKFELIRGQFIQIEALEFESAQSTTLLSPETEQFTAFILPSLNGKTFTTPVIPVVNTDWTDQNIKVYDCHTVGRNLSIGVKGAFDLNTIQMNVDSGGAF